MALDSYTKLMLHFNGADASTVFPDYSAEVNIVTPVGNAQVDTDQSEFGGASLLLDGTGDWLTIPDSANWTFGTADFTIDLWARWNALPGSGSLAMFYEQYKDASNFVFLGILNLGGTYYFTFQVDDGGSLNIDMRRTVTIVTDTWYHFALVRTGNTFKMFLGGTQQGADESNSLTIPDIAGGLIIGAHGDGNHCHNGWMDEFRVSKGIARWTGNFTPSTSAYGDPWIDVVEDESLVVTDTEEAELTSGSATYEVESAESAIITDTHVATGIQSVTTEESITITDVEEIDYKFVLKVNAEITHPTLAAILSKGMIMSAVISKPDFNIRLGAVIREACSYPTASIRFVEEACLSMNSTFSSPLIEAIFFGGDVMSMADSISKPTIDALFNVPAHMIMDVTLSSAIMRAHFSESDSVLEDILEYVRP